LERRLLKEKQDRQDTFKTGIEGAKRGPSSVRGRGKKKYKLQAGSDSPLLDKRLKTRRTLRSVTKTKVVKIMVAETRGLPGLQMRGKGEIPEEVRSKC